MRQFFVIALAFAAIACGQKEPPAPIADDATRRSISQGDIVGITTPDGAHSWRAVPYAAPPQGDLRWRAPRPPAPWDGVREATAYADRCMQLSNRLNAGEGIKPGKILGSEDCLYLDIYAPPDAAGKKLPVMVWVHGGANVWGRSSSYEGSKLAQNENVIIVAVQYRVGPFGFFAHPWLRGDWQTTTLDGAANFALLDLIQSLHWVRDNISAFGGDAGNVTIFGESAGGANIAALMASPLATGLFERAILQSGSFASAPLELAETEHKNASNTIVERISATNADELRHVDPEALFAAFTDGSFAFLDMPTMIEDGVSLPPYPMREAFASVDSFNAVPVITGTNRDEMKFFYFGDPRFVKRKFFLFPAPRDSVFYDRLNHYMGRVWRILSVDQPAAAMTAAGHEDVYAYRFDWDESGKFFLADFAELVGAGHAVEIPFVFNRFVFFGERYDKIFFEDETFETREELSRSMGAYWAAFARNGDPGDAGGARWAPWPADGAALMRFDSRPSDGVELIPIGDSFDQFTDDFLTDPALDIESRCAIAAEIEIWDRAVGESLADVVGCAAKD